MAACWLFPGEAVHVECPCLDCGEKIMLEIRDGDKIQQAPEGVIGVANYGFAGPTYERPFR